MVSATPLYEGVKKKKEKKVSLCFIFCGRSWNVANNIYSLICLPEIDLQSNLFFHGLCCFQPILVAPTVKIISMREWNLVRTGKQPWLPDCFIVADFFFPSITIYLPPVCLSWLPGLLLLTVFFFFLNRLHKKSLLDLDAPAPGDSRDHLRFSLLVKKKSHLFTTHLCCTFYREPIAT